MGDFRRWYDAAIDALWVGDRGGVFLDDVQSLGMGRGGGAAADSQLAVDVLEVGLDGVDGDAEFLRDLLAGLALDDQPHGHRLHPPGRKPAPPHFVAQERAERVADETVEYAPRLLRINPLHVNLARAGKGVLNGVARDLVELDAMHWPRPSHRPTGATSRWA